MFTASIKGRKCGGHDGDLSVQRRFEGGGFATSTKTRPSASGPGPEGCSCSMLKLALLVRSWYGGRRVDTSFDEIVQGRSEHSPVFFIS